MPLKKKHGKKNAAEVWSKILNTFQKKEEENENRVYDAAENKKERGIKSQIPEAI